LPCSPSATPHGQRTLGQKAQTATEVSGYQRETKSILVPIWIGTWDCQNLVIFLCRTSKILIKQDIFHIP
jgi:hypothetical protein